MKTGSLPEHLHDVFEAFPAFSTDDWLNLVARDLNTDSPREAITYDTGEGFSLQTLYRADDPEAQPLSIPDTPEATARCVYVQVDNQTEVGSLDVALSTEPDHVLLALKPGAEISREHVGTLLSNLKDSGVNIHLDGKSASLVASAIWNASFDEPPASLSLDVPGILASEGRLPQMAVPLARKLLDKWPSSSYPIAADGRYHCFGGGTMVNEIAGMLASATDTVDMLGDERAPEEILKRLHFVVPVGQNILLQIAKLRALRLLHQRWASAYLDGPPPAAYIHAISSERAETACDPQSNALRSTAAVMASYIGGADLVTARPHDVASGHPSLAASRLANNTALILEHETDIQSYPDAAERSYFLQAATRALATQAWQEFLWIEEHDGLIQSLEAGVWQDRIAENRLELEEDTRTRSRPLVGTSVYSLPDQPCEVQSDEGMRTATSTTDATIDTWQEFVEVARVGRTVPECQYMLLKGSTIATADPLPPIRLAEIFESLREEVRDVQKELGRNLKIFVVAAGRPALRAAKLRFTKDYLAAGGLAPRSTLILDQDNELSSQNLASHNDVVLVCANDKQAAKICNHIAEKRSDMSFPLIGVAGSPQSSLKQAGADFFIHRRSDVPATTRQILSQFLST